MLKFLSICSGIEAASVAFAPLGWEALAFAEIEPFPCAVLAHHYPQVPNLGDLTQCAHSPDGPRYKALGNSWAVPCARWIAQRIALHLSQESSQP